MKIKPLFTLILVFILCASLNRETINGQPCGFNIVQTSATIKQTSVIYISGNDDFNAKGFPGNGSVNNPYRIEGLDLTSASADILIRIQYTDAYFQISDCKLKGTSIGIWLIRVEHGTITNNTIHSNSWGIYLNSASNNTLSNNIIFNTSSSALSLYSQFGPTNNNIISENTIYNSSHSGIHLNGASNNTFFNNTIYNNIDPGISIFGDSNNNYVIGNNFTNNNPAGSQAQDAGSDNIFIYNYWNDWTTPDLDTDGIVDEPYRFSGDQDQCPLISWPSDHYLSLPIISCPHGDYPQLFSGNISISWAASLDAWGFSVTYNVFYSMDGNTWTLLIGDRTATSFVWDTNTVSDGSNYYLKVEAISTGGLNTSFTSTSHIIIDNTPPIIAIDSPLEQVYTSNTITVTLSSSNGAVNYWYYIESIDSWNRTWRGSENRTLADGHYTLYAYGRDGAGNIDHDHVTFTIETAVTTTPTITTITTEIPDEDSTLTIRGYFDGLDDILLRDDKLWIHHKTFGEPESLTLNGIKWELHFPQGGYDVDSYSNPLIGHTLLPMKEIICTLDIIEKPEFGTVKISQNPANENNFTLIITIDDRPTEGGYWYEFKVPCVQYKGSTTTTTSTSATTTPSWSGMLLIFTFVAMFVLRQRKKIRY